MKKVAPSTLEMHLFFLSLSLLPPPFYIILILPNIFLRNVLAFQSVEFGKGVYAAKLLISDLFTICAVGATYWMWSSWLQKIKKNEISSDALGDI